MQYRANGLRQKSTETEKILWPFLRNRKLNKLKFRRQHKPGEQKERDTFRSDGAHSTGNNDTLISKH
jgi:very-short-patch-repair endonuclease